LDAAGRAASHFIAATYEKKGPQMAKPTHGWIQGCVDFENLHPWVGFAISGLVNL
jgi:hypothetical protein